MLIAGIGCSLNAQVNRHQVKVDSLNLFLTADYILPSTLKVFSGDSLLADGSDYTLAEQWHSIIFYPSWLGKTVRIEYNVIPAAQFATRRRRELSTEFPALINPPDAATGSEEGGGDVVTNGVLLRGISFGNAQDLVLNSSLNLRMSGNLGSGIQIEAALTDQEYPFQAEGTTTTVQDFDRVYVKAFTRKWSVLLGDHAFTGPASGVYSKFAKKNRGIQIGYGDTLNGWVTRIDADAAIARGRFSRNEFAGIEGLQGPYRLAGARGEPFIIVVSGTEVVYLDGKRLERGYQADYIIDYNLGEITFMPKRLIGQNSRIVVEFQYTDRFYSRVVGALQASADKKQWGFFGSVYTETDLGNQPIQQDIELYDSTRGLTARQIMELAGDDPSLAVMYGARRQAAFSTAQPNYVQIDSAGVRFFSYKPAPEAGQVYYAVSFAFVGAGAGSYSLASTAANGKVYRYVGPGKGDYAPVNVLHTPNRTSLHEAGVIFRPGAQHSLKVTGAMSSRDLNLFSGIQDEDNRGQAVSLEWQQKGLLLRKPDSTRSWHISNQLKAEITGASFSTVERFRDVEFGRLWSRDLQNPLNGMDPSGMRYVLHVTEAGNQRLKFNTRWGFQEAGGSHTAIGLIQATGTWGRFYASPAVEFSNQNAAMNNVFRRQSAEIGYKPLKGAVKAEWWSESSLFYLPGRSNSLSARSYGFERWTLTAEKSKGRLTSSTEAAARLNRAPVADRIGNASQVLSLNHDLTWRARKSGFVKTGLGFRRQSVLDSVFSTLFGDEEHFTARMEWSFPSLFRALSGNIFYQTIAGREQQRQFSYFEVPAGQGFYSWIDFNSNGIQEVNEFTEAAFRDQARFVRLLVPTGTYIRAQGNELNGTLTWRPERLNRLKFHNRLSWNYLGRNTFNSGLKKYLPAFAGLEDVALISANGLLRNQAEAELLKNKWLLQLTSTFRGTKSMFTNGPEWRQSRSQSLFQRFDAGKSWQLRLNAEWRESRFVSAFLPALSFAYQWLVAEPTVVWQQGIRSRVSLSFRLQHADTAGSGTLATLREIQAGFSRSIGKNGMLDLRVSRLQYTYAGRSNTPLAFDLMQGYAAGANLRILAELRMNAARNVQVLVSYEGRKTGEVNFIHIGRAEARYLF